MAETAPNAPDGLVADVPVALASGDCAVTVSHAAGSDVDVRAQAVAAATGLRFVPRRGTEGDFAVVLEKGGAHLHAGDRKMVSHPGMGLVRVRRLVRGEEHDPLVDVTGVKAGDTVLDATFGFGQDALVFAWAVGETGRVDALEASPALCALALAGMPFWPAPGAELMRRVHLRHGDARTHLATLPDRSYDVVFFDPMFRKPQSAQPDFDLLRLLAEHSPLPPETLAEAKRVARRCVVVKDGFLAPELTRLGLKPAPSLRRRPEIVYGVLRVD